jgi:hypothetical protein
MINFKLKAQAFELYDYSALVSALLNNAVKTDILNAQNYFHFYNLQSVIKKLFVKMFDWKLKPHKRITINLNCNEWESLKFLFSHYQNELAENSYLQNLHDCFIAYIDKQEKQLQIKALL